MANPSAPSFIPKQPAKGKVKKRSTRKVYILTYVSFVLFFGALIASGGTFFYKLSMQAQLEAEQQRLAEERQRFNMANFEEVKEFDNKLTKAQELLDDHVSVLSVLEALEASTVSGIQLMSFGIDRTRFNSIAMEVEAVTDNFNSVLFQRNVYESNPVLEGAKISELDYTKTTGQETGSFFEEEVVSLMVEKQLELEDVRYSPRDVNSIIDLDTGLGNQTDQATTETESETGANTETEDVETNDTEEAAEDGSTTADEGPDNTTQ